MDGKELQPMESPRSRLVTWSCAHLSFLGRRFWRPHPDLDRSATPALPPGGGRPFAGAFGLLAGRVGGFALGPQRCWTGGRAPCPAFDGWGLLVAAGGAIGAVGGRSWRVDGGKSSLKVRPN